MRPAAVLLVVLVVAAAVAAVTAGRHRALAPAQPRLEAPALSTAGPFLLEELQDKLNGRWDRAWSTLFPLHQQVAVEAVYLRCERATPFLAKTLAVSVIRVRRTLVRVPGLHRRLPGAAITLHVSLAWFGPRDPIVLTPTFHLVAVDGRWRWLLSSQRYRMYTRETCGSLPPV